MRFTGFVIILAALWGCQQGGGIPEIMISPEDALDETTRVKLGLPPVGALTPATLGDIEFVKELSPGVNAVIERSIEPKSAAFQIIAARPVGNYLLLWIAFPEVMDGGVDVIYSVETKKLVGTFLGGYRG